MIKYIAVIISVSLGAVAQYMFKLGVERIKTSGDNLVMATIKNGHIIGGVACYGVSLLLWFYVLSQMELSKAYPMISLGYIITAIMGYFLLGENLNAFRIIGIGLICAGVIFVAKS